MILALFEKLIKGSATWCKKEQRLASVAVVKGDFLALLEFRTSVILKGGAPFKVGGTFCKWKAEKYIVGKSSAKINKSGHPLCAHLQSAD
jgi:hypothetical protein